MPNRAERRRRPGKGVILDRDKPLGPSKPKVISIGYCYSEKGGVAGRWHQSVVKLLASVSAAGFACRELPMETGPFLTQARNKILQRHLEFGDEYMLFTDTDIIFTPEDVGLLLAADAAIAGAHYLTAASGQQPWATALVEGESGLEPVTLPELSPQPIGAVEGMTPEQKARCDEEMSKWIAEYMAKTQPMKVAAVGFGLMLIKHEVVVAMAEKYDNPIEYVGNTGEDIVFCQRAAELGFETMLVPQARVGHLKVLEI